MDWKLEFVAVPVTDVDARRLSTWIESASMPTTTTPSSDELRFVQLTPPGSACSIAIGKGIVDSRPGSAAGLQLVVSDIQAARA